MPRTAARRAAALAACLALAVLAPALAVRAPAPAAAEGIGPVPAHEDHSTPQAVAERQLISWALDVAGALDASDPLGALRVRLLVAIFECYRFGCSPEVGTTTIAADPTLAGGFFSFPWPSDTRLAPDGSLDLSGFPADVGGLASAALANGAAATHGFGTTSATYLQATGPLDPASLPGPDRSIAPRSPVVLLDLDDPTAPPVPLLVDVRAEGTALRPADLVALLPYPGHPLRSSTRYAAVAFDELLDADGRRLAPSPLLAALVDPASSPPAGVPTATWERLRADHADALVAVRTRTLWHPSEVVAATVFTTQDTTADLAGIAAAVRGLPAPEVVGRTVDAGACDWVPFAHSRGELDLPRWQAGTPPHLSGGGGIVLDAGGVAVPQGTERVAVDLVVPCGPAPAGGWPILLWMDGTGASADARRISELGQVAGISDLPYAVASIAPLYSGDRAVAGGLGELTFFNYLNPLAAATNQLQQAADVLWLRRAAQSLALSPVEVAAGGVAHLDADTVVVAGHSQGALTLPLTLAAEPAIDAAFLSAGGAGLGHAIAHRSEVQDLLGLLLGVAPGEVDLFHPVTAVLQTFAERGDATNHGAAVTTPHVVAYAGLTDGCSPIESQVQLASALGLPVANPVTRQPLFGSSALEPPVVDLPVSANLPGGRTGVVVEVDHGHFGAGDNTWIGRSLVDSIAAGGPPTVAAGPFVAGSDSRCVRATPAPVP